MKRLFTLILAICMLVSGAALAEGIAPLTDEPVTISIGITQSSMVTDYDDNYYTKLLEEKLGVDVEVVLFPANNEEAKQKLQLMVASKEELPDIISTVILSDAEIASYGAQGVFLPLNDLLEENTYYLPMGIDKWCTEAEEAMLFQYATSPDGNIYSFPFYYSDPGDPYGKLMFINRTWLDNLNLEMPTTIDELYDVLVAFKEDDPNGNGEADEIPMCAHNEWWGDIARVLMNSFIYYSDYYWNAEDGQLSAPYVQDAFRDGLAWMNQLCEEGLLSPLSFTQGCGQLKSMIETGDEPEKVGIFYAHPLMGVNFPVSEKFINYEVLPVMIGPDGIQYSYAGIVTGNYTTHITKYCEDPALAVRFLDAMCEETISLSSRYGQQDVDWHYTTEGQSRYLDAFGYEVVYETADLLWASTNNAHWHHTALSFLPPALFGGAAQLTNYSSEIEAQNFKILEGLNKHSVGFQPEEQVGNLIYTADELAEIAEIEATIRTYVNESVVRFITGDLDIATDWEDYKAELNAMGLEKYQETAQTAYSRMTGK